MSSTGTASGFVAVTQQLDTRSSLGRLSLNVLLSFAQFEREIIGERTRDKISAARRKGKWTGGSPVLGYDVDPRGGRLRGLLRRTTPATFAVPAAAGRPGTTSWALANLDGLSVGHFCHVALMREAAALEAAGTAEVTGFNLYYSR